MEVVLLGGWRMGTGSSEEQEMPFLFLHLCRDLDPVSLPVESRGLYLWLGQNLLLWPLIG